MLQPHELNTPQQHCLVLGNVLTALDYSTANSITCSVRSESHSFKTRQVAYRTRPHSSLTCRGGYHDSLEGKKHKGVIVFVVQENNAEVTVNTFIVTTKACQCQIRIE